MSPRLIDRSRITCDWVCPRKRYWQYEYRGRGIVKASTNLALFTGIVIHDSLAAIATHHLETGVVPIDKIASLAQQQMKKSLLDGTDGEVGAFDYANEQAALVEGMLRGFYKHVWPRLLAQYPKIVAIEKECEYQISEQLTFMSKPDLILEDENGDWIYIEYKTTSSKKSEWIESWNTAVQLHSSIKAVEQTLGKAPLSVQIVGLYKGYHSYGKQSSPFCYAYKRNGNPPFTSDEVSYEYKAGLKRSPTWEMPSGVKGWVDSMPEEILADLFPMTPPIFVNEDLVENFFHQTELRETNIQMSSEFLNSDEDLEDDKKCELNMTFPQKFDQCTPAYGYGCEFKKLCHGRCEDPLREGFEFREAHHVAEMDAHAEMEVN